MTRATNYCLSFLRFVDELRPRAVMMENVPELAADERFATFCSRMQEFGYLGDSRVLNAAEYGVPQRRRRLIYLAGFHMEIPFAECSQRKRTVRGKISRLSKAGKSDDPLHDIPEKRTPRIMELIRRIPKDGGSRTDLPEEDQLECHKRCSGFKDVYGRMAWGDVAPTITSGCFNPSKGRFSSSRRGSRHHPSGSRITTGISTSVQIPHDQQQVRCRLDDRERLTPTFYNCSRQNDQGRPAE